MIPTKILIFEDNKTLRLSLKKLLNRTKGYKVVGDFENCENVAALIDR